MTDEKHTAGEWQTTSARLGKGGRPDWTPFRKAGSRNIGKNGVERNIYGNGSWIVERMDLEQGIKEI